MAMSSQSNFNPLERREWQSKGDRITHNVRLDLLRWGCRSYPEAEERFRRAVENLQIAIGRTDLLYKSHKFPSFIKNYKFQRSYREYEMCLQRFVEESKVFARSCDEYEDEHPELSQSRPILRVKRRTGQAKRRAGMESGRCHIDIAVGESSVDIKVQGEGSVNIRMKQSHLVAPPPYIP